MKIVKFLLIFGAIAMIIFFFSLGSIISGAVKAGIEAGGPVVTGTSVTLENAKVNPFSGSAYLENMVVGNPEGFQTDSAFKMGKVGMDIDVKSVLFGDTVYISDITIDGAEITFEIGKGGGNLLVIKSHAESLAASDAEPADKAEDEAVKKKADEKTSEEAVEPAEESKDSGKKLVITRMTFTNAKVRLSAPFMKGKSYVQPMPDLIMKDLGKEEGGTTPAQVMGQVFKQLIPLAIKTAKENKDLPGEMFKQLGENIKTEEIKEAVKNVDTNKLKEAGKNIGSKLKGLFGK